MNPTIRRLSSMALIGLAAAALPLAALASELSEAEVRKVDREAAKVTLKHGVIKNLDMPPMTMVFRVRDAAQLATLKAGDKVRFAAEQDKDGYVVTRIEPMSP